MDRTQSEGRIHPSIPSTHIHDPPTSFSGSTNSGPPDCHSAIQLILHKKESVKKKERESERTEPDGKMAMGIRCKSPACKVIFYYSPLGEVWPGNKKKPLRRLIVIFTFFPLVACWHHLSFSTEIQELWIGGGEPWLMGHWMLGV